MSAATIGALKVVLGLDVADFEGGLTAAQKELRKAGREFEKLGGQIQDIGKTMSAAITLPLVGLGVAVTKTAADFESAMNRVSISTQATGDEFKALSELAREIGRETVFSASTAADAIDMLAKAGVSVEDILGGAARAAVDLAAAAGSELDPAASAITDSMAQFKLTVEDLPRIVNGITGAVNESKLDFEDFTMAIGQAGGVAANVGVSFEDFNAVLAGTSPLFSSGSDAGTSFKTFLQRLVPTTTKAATAIAELGLEFHDAQGNLKPMREIAQQLQDALAGLSDQAKTDYLTTIFGTDAMRTAIGLMDQGAAGLDKIAEKIAATDAAAQSAQRMKGLNGQLEQLGGAFEEVAIAIGESGLLETVTRIVQAIASVMEKVAAASPAMLQLGVIFAAVAAAIGPVLIVVGALISAWGTLMGALAGGGVVAALGAFAVAAAPFIAAAAGIAAAIFIFRDSVGPVLREFGQALVDAVGPALPELLGAARDAFEGLGSILTALFEYLSPIIGKYARDLLEAFGPIIITAVRTFVAALTAALQLVGNTLKLVGAILSGDWSGAWRAAKDLVIDAVRGIGRIIEAIFPGAIDSVRRLYDGVKTWLQDKLGSVLNWVSNKAKEVGDAFFQLYDRVVGHSYVPDMVEEIGQWMAKLDETMVKPARRSTDEAAKAFEEVRDRANAAMEGLLTDQERAWRDHYNRVRELEDGIAQGGPNAAVYQIGLDRENAGWDASDLKMPEAPKLKPIGEDDKYEAFQDAQQRVADTIRRARDDFADSFASGMEAAMRDDWSGVLQSIVGDIFRNAMRSAGGSLFDALKGSGSGGGFSLGNIGSMFSSLFSKLPKFANGGSIMPGGYGGIDSQLVAFWKSPGEQVDVYTPSNDAGPVGLTRVIVEVNDDRFNAYVDSRAAPMAAQAAAAAVGVNRADMQTAQRRARQRFV